jgi:hypothetical protein
MSHPWDFEIAALSAAKDGERRRLILRQGVAVSGPRLIHVRRYGRHPPVRLNFNVWD